MVHIVDNVTYRTQALLKAKTTSVITDMVKIDPFRVYGLTDPPNEQERVQICRMAELIKQKLKNSAVVIPTTESFKLVTASKEKLKKLKPFYAFYLPKRRSALPN